MDELQSTNQHKEETYSTTETSPSSQPIPINPPLSRPKKKAPYVPPHKRWRGGKRPTPSKAEIIGVKAMLDAGQPVERVAHSARMNRRTVMKIRDGKTGHELSPAEITAAENELVASGYQNILRSRDFMTDDKFEKSSLLQLSIYGKIELEKVRLLQGKSTANVAHASLVQGAKESIEEINKRLSDLDRGFSTAERVKSESSAQEMPPKP